MALKYTGDAIIKVGLSVKTPKPIDDRLVVQTRADLYTIKPENAYEGMTVTDASTGNIYVLLDKSKIRLADGWSSSYESINFIPCTLEEYKILKNNTTDDYRPVDENMVSPLKDKPNYLLEDVYYYIYEDSLDATLEGLEYLKLTWGKEIEARISAINNSIAGTVDTLRQEVLNKEYATEKYVADNYLPLTFLDGAEGGLSGILNAYYTKNEANNEFVHKSDLVGDAEDQTDYKFVTSKKYKEDQEKFNEYLEEINQNFQNIQNNKLDKGTFDDSLTTKLIVASTSINTPKIINATDTVEIKDGIIFINSQPIALALAIPKLITLSQEEYDTLEEKMEDVYYHIYNTDENLAWVTYDLLDKNYYTKPKIDSKILLLLTKDDAKSLYLPKGEYLTEHQNIDRLLIKDMVEDTCVKRTKLNDSYLVFVNGQHIEFRLIDPESGLTTGTGLTSWLRHVISDGADVGVNVNTITLSCGDITSVMNNSGTPSDTKSEVDTKLVTFFLQIALVSNPSDFKLNMLKGKNISLEVSNGNTSVIYKIIVD